MGEGAALRMNLPVAYRVDMHVTAILHAEQRCAIQRGKHAKVCPRRLEMLTRSVERQVDRQHEIRHVLLAYVQRDLLLVWLISSWSHGIAVA